MGAVLKGPSLLAWLSCSNRDKCFRPLWAALAGAPRPQAHAACSPEAKRTIAVWRALLQQLLPLETGGLSPQEVIWGWVRLGSPGVVYSRSLED